METVALRSDFVQRRNGSHVGRRVGGDSARFASLLERHNVARTLLAPEKKSSEPKVLEISTRRCKTHLWRDIHIAFFPMQHENGCLIMFYWGCPRLEIFVDDRL